MRIVMDFDGVYTDPSAEGLECARNFNEKIVALGLKDLETPQKVESWLGELRVRQARDPFKFGWRSEGRVSAFTFEDPFIRNIGMADYLDHLVKEGDARAKLILSHLVKKEKIQDFGSLSEWSFHQLKIKKEADPAALRWVREALKNGHEVIIVSNSATEKIEDFLTQNEFGVERPKVRGGARKFGLGTQKNAVKKIAIAQSPVHGAVEVHTDRPLYEAALMELQPDAVVGDVFSLDLALPVRLKREKKLALKGGIYYRLRDYTPSTLVDYFSKRQNQVPEVTTLRDWSQLKLDS